MLIFRSNIQVKIYSDTMERIKEFYPPDLMGQTAKVTEELKRLESFKTICHGVKM